MQRSNEGESHLIEIVDEERLNALRTIEGVIGKEFQPGIIAVEDDLPRRIASSVLLQQIVQFESRGIVIEENIPERRNSAR